MTIGSYPAHLRVVLVAHNNYVITCRRLLLSDLLYPSDKGTGAVAVFDPFFLQQAENILSRAVGAYHNGLVRQSGKLLGIIGYAHALGGKLIRYVAVVDYLAVGNNPFALAQYIIHDFYRSVNTKAESRIFCDDYLSFHLRQAPLCLRRPPQAR